MKDFKKLKDEIRTRVLKRGASKLLQHFENINREEMKKLGIDMILYGQSYYSIEDGVIKRLPPF